MDAVHTGYIVQFSLVDYTEARVAVGISTVLYKELMTEFTVLFRLARVHFTKETKNMFAFQTSTDARFKCMQTGALLPRTQVQLGQA